MNEREMLEKMDLLRARFNVPYSRAFEVLSACNWDPVQATLKLEADRPDFVQSMKVKGADLVEKVKELVHEGNINRIVVKEESGREVLNLPVNGALALAVLAPLLAALGAVAALAVNYDILVERSPR